ncbi:MAG: AAA family ATPase [Flavobacteriales bacterium]|nr:MAG: AAA family ATPase [Flavobacteriales bacterium]
MRLNLTTKYKSLTPISIDLPDLTILTGINGAGKTQILSGLARGIIQLTDKGAILNPPNGNTCKYVSAHSLTPNDSVIVTREQLNQNTKNLWDIYQGFQHTFRTQPQRLLEHHIGDVRQRKIIETIAKKANKAISELTSDDFYNHYPPDDAMHNDIFYQSFSNLFKRYQDKYDDNQYRQFRKDIKKHNEIEYLTDEQFLQIFGEAPWDFVNKIIKEAKLDYHINSPFNSNRDAPFELKLVNNFNSAEIQFSELSSGEKVLMSLALALYNSNRDLEFPKVLLMDEPDASLHPSMSKQFLDVIERVFVKDKGVKVIVTTHSPSTVALCNEDNLFVMNKTGQRVEKTTKDRALKILTSGVPALSINYENRRQVFVESKYDVLFYDKAYDKLRVNLVNDVSLNFISSGVDGSGNCDQVKQVVGQLSDFGNKSIFGIIDWDKKNNTNGYVKVLGENKRYSIENYLFDPLLITSLLLRDKIISRVDIGLVKNESYSDFKNLSTPQLQVIADFLTAKIFPQINPSDNTKIKVKYISGIEIEIPQWYLHHQGHDLETHLKTVFPQLNKYNKDGELKKEMINKIIDDIPELIPTDILELFRDIQTH